MVACCRCAFDWFGSYLLEEVVDEQEDLDSISRGSPEDLDSISTGSREDLDRVSGPRLGEGLVGDGRAGGGRVAVDGAAEAEGFHFGQVKPATVCNAGCNRM